MIHDTIPSSVIDRARELACLASDIDVGVRYEAARRKQVACPPGVKP